MGDTRRSFIYKMGLLLAGVPLVDFGTNSSPSTGNPPIFSKPPASDDVPPTKQRLASSGGLEPLSTVHLPLPEGFVVMSAPTEVVMWNGEERQITAHTQRLKASLICNDPAQLLTNDDQALAKLVDYDKLTQELHELKYTHLYQIVVGPTLYNPENFIPCRTLSVRGCCLPQT